MAAICTSTFYARRPGLSTKKADEVLQSIWDRETSDISNSENEDDVDDVNAAYDSDTEEYAGSSSDSDDDGFSGAGISQRHPLWKAADSSPANNVPVLETACVFSKARLEFSPADYNMQYVDDNMLEKMAEKTNQRILRKRGIISEITGQEVKQFLGCSMLMGVIGYLRIRFFWKKGLAVSSVADTMPRDRFFLLRSNLCCQLDDDISDDDKKSERLWKVAPFVEMVRKGCLGLERPNCFCVDEQVIPFSGRCPMKQYIPNKPNPVGLKNFVLAGKDGWLLSSERASLSAWIVPHINPGLARALFRRLAAISALISWDPFTYCVMRHQSV
ncbi:hypothetical protein MRX96_000111 [Rhipicephalus microplus]